MSSMTSPKLHSKGKKRGIEEVGTSPGKGSKKAKAVPAPDLHNRYRNIEDYPEADWNTESEAESDEYISDEGSEKDEGHPNLHWSVQQRLDEMTEMLRDSRLTHWYLKMIAKGLGTWCRGGRNADIAEGLIGHLEYLAQDGSKLRDERAIVKEVYEISRGGGCAFDSEGDDDGEGEGNAGEYEDGDDDDDDDSDDAEDSEEDSDDEDED